MQKVMTDAATSSGACGILFDKLPTDVELCRRVAPDHTVYILINHAKATQQVTLPRAMHELLRNKTLNSISLESQGVAVFLLETKP